MIPCQQSRIMALTLMPPDLIDTNGRKAHMTPRMAPPPISLPCRPLRFIQPISWALTPVSFRAESSLAVRDRGVSVVLIASKAPFHFSSLMERTYRLDTVKCKTED